MEIINQNEHIPFDLSRGACVTIGNFDGVHLGHQKLISRVINKALAADMTSVVVTFTPHPLRVLVGPHTPPSITVRKRKMQLLEALGLDMVLLLEFTHELAALSPREFVKTYLVDLLKTRELVIGYDYSFGKNRSGNYKLLKELGEQYGFHTEQLEPVIINDAIVSSTRIRDLIENGQVWDVRPLLGRFYVIQGNVIKGKDRGGRLLGFPTANLKIENEVHPATGVYAVWAEVDGGVYPCVANIGYNPTFGNREMSIEAHILDFNKDITGRLMRLHFVQRLRSEKKFSSLEELMARIQEDVDLGRQILAAPEAQLS